MTLLTSWIDAHCHLSDSRFAGQESLVIEHARQAGVRSFVLGGVDPEEWERQLILKEKHPQNVFCVFGIHPWFVDENSETEQAQARVWAALKLLPSILKNSVGLGELGLDYGPKRAESSREFQVTIFTEQLKIAKVQQLPLVLHVVRAHEDSLKILEAHAPYPRGGIGHAISGRAETARKYIELGFTLSIGGAAAQVKGYETLKRAISKIPADRLVIESDSPDFIPNGYKGVISGLNDPGCLPRIAEALGKLRGEKPSQLLITSRQNLEAIFGLELQRDSG